MHVCMHARECCTNPTARDICTLVSMFLLIAFPQKNALLFGAFGKEKINRNLFKNSIKFDTFKASEEQNSLENVRFFQYFWKSQKNDHEAKTYGFGCHLEAILGSSWGTLEAFGGHFGRLGANLSQRSAILRHLGATLGPPWANMTPTWANMSQHGASGTLLDGSKRLRPTSGSHH